MSSYCKICNKKLSRNTCVYCRKHFIKSIKGKNHYNWKGGLPKCEICKKKFDERRKNFIFTAWRYMGCL